jgi:hypothetical protein
MDSVSSGFLISLASPDSSIEVASAFDISRGWSTSTQPADSSIVAEKADGRAIEEANKKIAR